MKHPVEVYNALRALGIEHIEANKLLSEARTYFDKDSRKSEDFKKYFKQYADFLDKTVAFLELNYKNIIKANLIKKLQKEFPLLNFTDYIKIEKSYEAYPYIGEQSLDTRFDNIVEFIQSEIYRLYTYVREFIVQQQERNGNINLDEIFTRINLIDYSLREHLANTDPIDLLTEATDKILHL